MVAALVLIVKVDVALWPAIVTDIGFIEQVGPRETAGETEQLKASVPVKPSRAVRLIVAVADCPAAIELGVAEAGASIAKSDTLNPSGE